MRYILTGWKSLDDCSVNKREISEAELRRLIEFARINNDSRILISMRSSWWLSLNDTLEYQEKGQQCFQMYSC